MDLFGRITVPYSVFEPVLKSFEEVSEKLVIYEHNDDPANAHIHFYIKSCKVSTDTLKNYCKRHSISGGSRGSGWSFKSARDDGCITYMSKGRLTPSFVKGYTDEELEVFKSKWQPKQTSKYQTKLQYIVKESPSEAKKRKNDLVQEMIIELNGHKPVNLEYYVDEAIVRVIIKILNDNNVIFGRYTIRDYYDTICSRSYTEQFVQSMIKFMSPKT